MNQQGTVRQKKLEYLGEQLQAMGSAVWEGEPKISWQEVVRRKMLEHLEKQLQRVRVCTYCREIFYAQDSKMEFCCTEHRLERRRRKEEKEK